MYAFAIHVVDSVSAATAHTNHFYDAVLFMWFTKVKDVWCDISMLIFHIVLFSALLLLYNQRCFLLLSFLVVALDDGVSETFERVEEAMKW